MRRLECGSRGGAVIVLFGIIKRNNYCSLDFDAGDPNPVMKTRLAASWDKGTVLNFTLEWTTVGLGRQFICSLVDSYP